MHAACGRGAEINEGRRKSSALIISSAPALCLLPSALRPPPSAYLSAVAEGRSKSQYENHCRKRPTRSTSSHGSPERESSCVDRG